MAVSGRSSSSRQTAGRHSVHSPREEEGHNEVRGQVGRHSKGEANTKVHGERLLPEGAVAIDLGAYTVRVVIASASKTSSVFRCPNAIVRVNQRRGSSGSSSMFIGPQIQSQNFPYASLSLRQPTDRGLVVDWAAQKSILDAALKEVLAEEADQKRKERQSTGVGLLEGRAVIITEAYFNLPDLQLAMDLLIMQEYGAHSIWRCCPASLLPYTPNLFTPPEGTILKRDRPECMLVVDLGHGASHIVPLIGDKVIWKAARRHIVSGRLITNLLKETLSFRQWDMMDETWLVGHIKESCCFVASKTGRRGDPAPIRASKPSCWSFAAMLEMCQSTPKTKNPLVQEYVLPDYSGPKSSSRFGHIRRGPGSTEESKTDDDLFIADIQSTTGDVGDQQYDHDTESEEEADDSDESFSEGEALENGESDTPPRKRHKNSINGRGHSRKEYSQRSAPPNEEESEQVLLLERERFQVPEVMFNPGIIGLDDAPLHEVIWDSIKACDTEIQGLLWANIVLVGGGAAMRGLETRLYNELRPMAGVDGPLQIWRPENPSMATIYAARNVLNSPSTSERHEMLSSRLMPTKEYTLANANERFGSWSSSKNKL